jgi:hypothetical protein
LIFGHKYAENFFLIYIKSDIVLILIAIFRQYGMFLKTHRIFRQYLWAALGPYAWAQLSTRAEFGNTVEVLWGTHATRMANHDLSDPNGTKYPAEINYGKVNYITD